MAMRNLFSQADIHSVVEHQKQVLKKKIQELDHNYILNVSEDDIVQWLVDEYRMEVPIILDDEIHVADHGETQVDVSRDPNRFFRTRGPFYVTGTKVTIAVPFEGDAGFFDIRPSSWSSVIPFADIAVNEVHLEYKQADVNGEIIQREYLAAVTRIKEYLGWLQSSAESFNSQLESLVRQDISDRKKKLLASAGMVASLGLPIKKREGVPNTYAVPVKRQKPRIEKPKATNALFQPEHALALEEYEKILSIVKNMVFVMEQSPSAFEHMGEEDLRTHFLVQLNGQYEGQATGETFNFQGKTDILIRAEGKNVFIAECKFWNGEKKFLATIDQLLSYLSWRDTKTAVLIFNRKANFTEVLSKIAAAAPSHPCFKRDLGKADETTFRYIFHQPSDPSRELRLTAMAFDVPAKKKAKTIPEGT